MIVDLDFGAQKVSYDDLVDMRLTEAAYQEQLREPESSPERFAHASNPNSPAATIHFNSSNKDDDPIPDDAHDGMENGQKRGDPCR